ncbi:MAG: methyltransferase domain-containing protein [Alphaproteobacteria bacterium]|nr:methyltransferase domain-containing protein [Alphaproteobacteria bacterium]
MAPTSIRPGRSGTEIGAASSVLTALRDAAALLRQGRAADAAAAYRRIVKANPAHAEAQHNLGVALRASGRGEEALAAYRRAIELRPGYAGAHHHLAQALDAAGQPMESLKHHVLAYRQARDRVEFAQALATALRPVRLKGASPAVVEALSGLFAERDIDHQDLMAVTAGLLLARDGMEEDRLFHALMRHTIVADELLELAIAGLRRRALDRFEATGALDDRELAASIACQAFAGDFALAESAEERRLVDAMAARIGDERLLATTAGDLLLAIGMYRPLGTLPGAADLARRVRGGSDAVDLVLARQIDAPAQEAELAAGIAALTPIDDAVSAKVRAQYEENPYPRWGSITRRPARWLSEVVTDLFPTVQAETIPPPPHRVLVAGCGTGRHALAVAFRFAEADILAVDLSRASLAYGMRRARELGVDNIRFRQADILGLGAIDERFDLIEASGVLHHMADPEAGWRVLAGLLKPGGFIKLGLYSTLGRQGIAAARAFVAARGFPATAEGIRAARQAIRALDNDDSVHKVADELDFASLSGCRDLLFHVQERSYRLGEIEQAIGRLGMSFLGFEIADEATRAAYAKMFPRDRERRDLANWRKLEEQRPQTFRTMYQFWCRKP